ncbi:hypothetical protein PQX77_013395 [Marasmius sp. AFHP31]|nr:hypothetical protein PQX77_013395 [Marasmius sp. AFHP31]
MSLQLLKHPVYVDLNNPSHSSATHDNANGIANHSSTSPDANNTSLPSGVLSRVQSTFGWRSSSRSTPPPPSIPISHPQTHEPTSLHPFRYHRSRNRTLDTTLRTRVSVFISPACAAGGVASSDVTLTPN